jgi:hypothetical protein
MGSLSSTSSLHRDTNIFDQLCGCFARHLDAESLTQKLLAVMRAA